MLSYNCSMSMNSRSHIEPPELPCHLNCLSSLLYERQLGNKYCMQRLQRHLYL